MPVTKLQISLDPAIVEMLDELRGPLTRSGWIAYNIAGTHQQQASALAQVFGARVMTEKLFGAAERIKATHPELEQALNDALTEMETETAELRARRQRKEGEPTPATIQERGKT